MERKNRPITIVGAGMSGCLMAIYMARRGYDVKVFERRNDIRGGEIKRGRSINMTLAARGLRALEEVRLLGEVMRITTPLRGRIIHAVDGRITYQPYGKNSEEVIHSVLRTQLNITLLNFAEQLPNIEFVFNTRCIYLEKNNRRIQLYDEVKGNNYFVDYDLLIGADGAFSTIRQQMHKGERADYKQDFLNHGYKEIPIIAEKNGASLMDREGLHIWPRQKHMLLAMPNPDGSFTGTLILPFEGTPSFASLKTEETILELFNSSYPDVVDFIPGLVDNFLKNNNSEMITLSTSPWHYRDHIVLLGDACHTVVPFYGMGMNVAFEDCFVLDKCIDKHPGCWKSVFAEYQSLRKCDTDALADLSKQNFIELQDKINSPLFVARKRLDVILNGFFPKAWIPLYTLVSHTNLPIAEAVESHARKRRTAKLLGIDILILFVAGLMLLKDYLERLKLRNVIAGLLERMRWTMWRPTKIPREADNVSLKRDN